VKDFFSFEIRWLLGKKKVTDCNLIRISASAAVVMLRAANDRFSPLPPSNAGHKRPFL